MEKLTKKQEEILTVLKKFIAENNYPPTIREMCDKCNLSSSATMFVHMQKLADKGYIDLSEGKTRKLKLNVPNEYEKPNNLITIPLINKNFTGNIEEELNNPTKTIEITRSLAKNEEKVFAYIMKDNSMINMGIKENDYIILKVTEKAENGDVILVHTDKYEITLKKLQKDKDIYKLLPESDYLPPIICKDIKIYGKLLSLYRIY